MSFCPNCGKELNNDAESCEYCGYKTKKEETTSNIDSSNIARFCLTFFLGFIGSFIINHTTLKPKGWMSRTCAYFFLGLVTFDIYPLVASIFNFTFNPNQSSNIGYYKDGE